jgi:hypothetical protein
MLYGEKHADVCLSYVRWMPLPMLRPHVVLSVIILMTFGSLAALAHEEETVEVRGPSWLVMSTPIGGYIDNEVSFSFQVPSGTDGSELVERHASLSDGAWEIGRAHV